MWPGLDVPNSSLLLLLPPPLQIQNDTGTAENTLLVVGYLRSYERMGQFELCCLRGCMCNSSVTNSHVPSLKNSQMELTILEVTASGQPCMGLGPSI